MSKLLTIKGIRGFIDNDGVAQLNLEDVARGLGFTETAKSGNETLRWRTIIPYLVELKAIAGSCDAVPTFIPENIFYRLAMKAKNETAEKFQSIVADEILPAIRKTGTYSAKQVPQSKLDELEVKSKNADARLKNANLRQANFLLENAEKFRQLLGSEANSLLTINALEIVAGKDTLPRPKLAEIKYYSATEIGKIANVSSNRVGKVANDNKLKTEQYGITILDKSQHSSKQIPSFRYNEAGKDKLLELLSESEVS